MAKIIENEIGRRLIRLSADDVINIVREYQNATEKVKTFEETRKYLFQNSLYLPEEI